MDSSNQKQKSITKKFLEIFPITFKRKPDLIESDRGKDFHKKILQIFLNNNNIQPYSRNIYLGAVFTESFNRNIRDLLERPVFERGNGNWIDILPEITKQYNITPHSSTILTSIQTCLKKNEGFAYSNILYKRKKVKPKF